jgi:beta-glucanase (GH16 family)
LSLGAPGSGARWLPYFAQWGTRNLKANGDVAIKMAGFESTPAGASVRETLLRYKPGPEEPAALHEVRNGVLMLRAQPLPVAARESFWGFPYIAGMISGEEAYAQSYGYWEIRLRLDNVGHGLHFAAWLLPNDGSWPPEIDLLEVVGRYPDTLFQNAHVAGHNPDMTRRHVASLSRSWMTIGFLWTPSVMRWTVNGDVTREQQNAITGKSLYPLFSWEVGNTWAGHPDATTKWPAQVSVDYIRVYQPIRQGHEMPSQP